MKRLASTASVAAGCALILLSDFAILATAAWNRRGEPEARLTLTERELALPGGRQDEGTGLVLSLLLAHDAPGVVRRTARWKQYELPSFDYPWLDRDKLRELGCRTDLDPADPVAAERYGYAMARRVYLVVEYEGEAWKHWLEGRGEEVRQLRRQVEEGAAERSALVDAEALLALDRTMRSRLVAVDAGLDADLLRLRYPDGRRFAVLAGLLRPKILRPEGGAPVLSGQLEGLLAGRVHVTRELLRHLEPYLPDETWEEVETRERNEAAAGWPIPTAPRYGAVLAVGRRHEPWLVDVTTPTQTSANVESVTRSVVDSGSLPAPALDGQSDRGIVAHLAVDDDALRVHDQDRRSSADAVADEAPAIGVDRHLFEERFFPRLQETGDGVGLLVADRQHLDSLATGKGQHLGHGQLARLAPGRPEEEQPRAATEIGQFFVANRFEAGR